MVEPALAASLVDGPDAAQGVDRLLAGSGVQVEFTEGMDDAQKGEGPLDILLYRVREATRSS
jgi:hypothetical protein